MNNYEKALEAVANGIIKRMERECTAQELFVIAQAAAAIVSADKMASENLVQPLTEKTDNEALRLNPKDAGIMGAIIPAGVIN